MIRHEDLATGSGRTVQARTGCPIPCRSRVGSASDGWLHGINLSWSLSPDNARTAIRQCGAPRQMLQSGLQHEGTSVLPMRRAIFKENALSPAFDTHPLGRSHQRTQGYRYIRLHTKCAAGIPSHYSKRPPSVRNLSEVDSYPGKQPCVTRGRFFAPPR